MCARKLTNQLRNHFSDSKVFFLPLFLVFQLLCHMHLLVLSATLAMMFFFNNRAKLKVSTFFKNNFTFVKRTLSPCQSTSSHVYLYVVCIFTPTPWGRLWYGSGRGRPRAPLPCQLRPHVRGADAERRRPLSDLRRPRQRVRPRGR